MEVFSVEVEEWLVTCIVLVEEMVMDEVLRGLDSLGSSSASKDTLHPFVVFRHSCSDAFPLILISEASNQEFSEVDASSKVILISLTLMSSLLLI